MLAESPVAKPAHLSQPCSVDQELDRKHTTGAQLNWNGARTKLLDVSTVTASYIC